MNDDFLYRLRTDPPPHFAETLKARLDRGTKRSVRAWHFGLIALLFGTAFAMVTYWKQPAPVPTSTNAPAPIQRGLARVFADKPVPRTESAVVPAAPPAPAGEDLKAAVRALLEEERGKRQLPVTLPPVPSLSETPATAGADSDADDSQTAFIVTGPLASEYGTPAYTFETRRAYFTVMEWIAKPLQDMVTRRAPMDAKKAQTAAARLMALMTMMPELFEKDERASGVPTRTRSAVWEQRASFVHEIFEFSRSVQALSVAAKSNDEPLLKQATISVFKGCSSCHDKFREGGSRKAGAAAP
jgi:cytochrome c556